MKITRIYAGDDGQSHFQDLDIPEDLTQRRATTDAIDAERVAFGLSPALPMQDWHHAPRRQLVAVLSGALEIEVAGGEKRRFNPGDCFIADDLAGRGHRTEDVSGPVRLLYVHLPDTTDFTPWRT
jgi:quercetin dioxygenase-like cupin family protein